MGLFRRDRTSEPSSPDPDLERFHRGVAAAEAGPPAWEEGAALEGDDLEGLRTWMAERFERGRYDLVWSRRVALGLSLVQGNASTETWFWVNAHPALAILRSGEPHHPWIATAAGYADEAQRSLRGQSDVAAAMAEINERFFADGP